ncbi:hypothetical protein MUG91_G3n325 [Manis pentadactyla]|nr:hypothetical protein MUG91_G3n325 [Manis pentadactyla]
MDRHCQFRDLPTTRKPISIELLQVGGQESPLTGSSLNPAKQKEMHFIMRDIYVHSSQCRFPGTSRKK